MRIFNQFFVLCYEENHQYFSLPNCPEFYNEKEALNYWEKHKKMLIDNNFYKKDIVIAMKQTTIRRILQLEQ